METSDENGRTPPLAVPFPSTNRPPSKRDALTPAFSLVMSPGITDEERRSHYTRLQIVTKARGYSLPDKSCILEDLSENKDGDLCFKALTISSFLALTLVRGPGDPAADVVAVAFDQYPEGRIAIQVARNCSTPDDANQANSLKSLFVETFINAQSPPNPTNFRHEYLRLMLSWGTEKFKSRLLALTYGVSAAAQGTLKGKIKAKLTLNIVVVIDALTAIRNEHAKVEEVRKLSTKYLTTNNDSVTTSGKTPLFSGDLNLLMFSRKQKNTVLDIVLTWLAYVQKGISEFHKGNWLGNHDYKKISLLLSCCDMLGNSWICRELLDISGNFTPPAQHHFMRSLRKIGVYRVGIKKLYDSVTKCTKVKEIDVMVLPSPQDSSVSCHTDWYRFLCDEARVVLQKDINTSKAKLESAKDLSKYKANYPASLHCEVNLALYRRSKGHYGGEIGVSKDCCATCVEALSALRGMNSKYMVKKGHLKHYVAKLTENEIVDRAIIARIKGDFEQWLREMDIVGDSDVDSDHNGTLGEDEQEDFVAEFGDE